MHELKANEEREELKSTNGEALMRRRSGEKLIADG
jgi:hypothetical protein